MNLILNNILKFIGLALLQVLIVSNFELSYYINPYIHLLFLLTLPFQTSTALLLILGFFSGFVLDMFLNTLGLHTAASVWLAFVRPGILALISPKGGFEGSPQPGISTNGAAWFFLYLTLGSFAYMMVYFFLEVFTFTEFFQTTGKIFLSIIFSVVLMFMLTYLFSPDKKRKAY